MEASRATPGRFFGLASIPCSCERATFFKPLTSAFEAVWLDRKSERSQFAVRDPGQVNGAMMKLQQLETFFWTVKLGSFAAAADRLHATQSTISMRIRELERGLGVELFDRTQRSAKLTPKGRELMGYAERILDMTTELEHRIAAPEAITGDVRLGVAEVVSITWLPKLVQLISRNYPGVRLEINEGLTSELMDGLRDGAIDLVLAPGHVPTQSASVRSLGRVEFAWLASPELKLGTRTFSPMELAEFPIIGLKSGSFHYAGIHNWFQHDNVRCNYLAQCKSMAVAASMTIAGLGISFLPIRCYQEAIDSGKLAVINTSSPFDYVEFIAAMPVGELHPLATRVAELAEQVSDFEREQR